MSLRLSEEKRNAILIAAAQAVAVLGVSAPTAKIALGAGIAEGTLFSYFQTKDVLLNQLYIEIRKELVTAILASYESRSDLSNSWHRVWDGYIDWGITNPPKYKAMRQLSVSEKISNATRKICTEGTQEIAELLEETRKTGIIREQSPEFITGIFEALAEMTLEFITREPERHEYYKYVGFEALWNAISRR